jgi:hypothetical protein
MPALQTEIRIDAPAEKVWEVLTDFARYPDWNPFIPEADGSIGVGDRLRVRIHPPGKRPMIFRPRVLRADPGRELRWLGHLGIPGLFDGEHVFRLEESRRESGRPTTRLVHRESFRGILTPLVWPGMEEATRSGFHAMNEALKARVEGGSVPAPD